jgi:hypothetical protein
MRREERNKLAQLKGEVKRAMNTLKSDALQIAGLPEFSDNRFLSTKDAVEVLGDAVLKCDFAIEILEGVLETINAEKTP